MTDCNLKLSYNPTLEMATTSFIPVKEDVLFEDAGSVLRMKGRYSPFIFKNNYRSGDNYIPGVTNCLILDFDDGFTREDFKKRSSFAYATGTTKSNNKDKNGKICERFRVIIPTETAIHLDSFSFSKLMVELFFIYPEADTACKDTARAYSGYTGAEVDIHYGEYFDWEPLYEKSVSREEFRKWQKQQREKPIDYQFTQDDTFKAMESRFKSIYTSGNRNNATADIVLWCKNEGIDYPTIETFVTGLVENSGDPLPDKEVLQILKYHFRR